MAFFAITNSLNGLEHEKGENRGKNFRRSGDSRESIPAPDLPDWCLDEQEGFSDNEEQNGETADDGSRPDGGRKRLRRDPRLKVSWSLSSLPGACHLVLLVGP